MIIEQNKQQIIKALGLETSAIEIIIKHENNMPMIHKQKISKFNINSLQDIDITFDTCTFDCELIINDGSRSIIDFVSCCFNQSVSYDFRYKMVENQYSFIKCSFYSSINLAFLTFEKEIIFKESILYEEINCFQTKFNNLSLINLITHKIVDLREVCLKQVNINNVLFVDRVFFDKAKFYGDTTFHQVYFEGGVYFKKSIFDGNLKFIENLFQKNFIFVPELKKDVSFNQCYFDVNLVSDFDFQKQHISDFLKQRKMFSSIKASLSKHLNTIDANIYHKYELYCKEIELDSKKPQLFSKDFIDKIQLFFYRITSDHHTDLLKSLHSLLIVIGIFAFLNIIVILGFNYYCLDYISLYFNALIAHYNMIIKNLSNNYTLLIICNFILFILFIGIFFISILFSTIRKCVIIISYILDLALLIYLPKYIIPTISIFTDKRIFLDPLSTIGGIYTILFAIMLFSFIKTARKNSIIPS